MFDHILVPLDGSSLAECVLPHVVALARAFESRVTLLQVMEQTRTRASGSERFVDPLGWYMGAAEAKTYMSNTVTRLQRVGLSAEHVLLEGSAAERIIEFARRHEIDLIVLSSHGRSGLSGWNVSSVVMKIILRAYLPLMIVRAYQPSIGALTELRYRRLMLPLDCSRRAECVLPPATNLARFYDSELLAVHVVSEPQMPHQAPLTRGESQLLDRIIERNHLAATRYLKQLASRLDVDVQTHLATSNHVAATLHELTDQADVDLVALSAHGYSGVTKWPYGSIVINFIGYGVTPLLIVQDFSSEEIEHTRAEMATREYKGH